MYPILCKKSQRKSSFLFLAYSVLLTQYTCRTGRFTQTHSFMFTITAQIRISADIGGEQFKIGNKEIAKFLSFKVTSL